MPRHRILARFLAVGFLLLVVLVPTFVAAQTQEGFQAQANEIVASFPDSISFYLTATIPAPVDSVELEYGVVRVSCSETSTRIVPDLRKEEQQPGQVAAEWTWDLRRSGSLPPGARIWWQWHIATEDDQSWSTPIAWFTVEDDRYSWQTLTQGDITILWYVGDEEFGRQMLQAAVESQARLTTDPGATLEEPVHLYFYADSGALKDAVLFPQRWTGGLAFTDLYTILIAAGPGSREYGESTVAHELMHLVVHQLTFNCTGDIPRWLDEGLAVWAEGGLDEHQQEALDEAIAEDKLLSLRSLNASFSAHADRASMAYAQSCSAVVFMIEEYGREKILELLATFREGASYDGALEQVYGFDTDGLEDLWRASVGAVARPTDAAPAASPTVVPTLALWGGSPTNQPAIATAEAAPSATLPPAPTATPEQPTAVAAEQPSPTALAQESAPPTPIGGLDKGAASGGWPWYAIAGAALTGVLVLALVVVLVRRR